MPILNMVGGGKKGGNIGEPLNLTVTTSGLDATIKWEDNEIGTIPPTTFAKSELVRKIGSAPTSPSDGVLVVTETVKDTYKVNGYVDQRLTGGTTYYYRVFSYSDLGGISYCDAESVTPSAGGWQPGVNTVAYYPLSADLVDTVHNQTLSAAGSYTFNQVGGATINSISIDNILTGTNSYLPTGTNVRTISLWCYITAWGQNDSAYFAYGTAATNKLCCVYGKSTQTQISQYGSSSGSWTAVSLNTWTHLCVVYDGSKFIMYKDGTQIGTWTKTIDTQGSNVWINQIPWANPSDGVKTGHWSNVIIEDKVRTAQEISDYYDLTKGNYGL